MNAYQIFAVASFPIPVAEMLSFPDFQEKWDWFEAQEEKYPMASFYRQCYLIGKYRGGEPQVGQGKLTCLRDSTHAWDSDQARETFSVSSYLPIRITT